MSRYPPKLPDDSPTFNRPPSYRSYLLRIWEERGDRPAAAVWRFNLEDPHTGERRGFSSLDAVVKWLSTELKASCQSLDLHAQAFEPPPPHPSAPPKAKRVRRPLP